MKYFTICILSFLLPVMVFADFYHLENHIYYSQYIFKATVLKIDCKKSDKKECDVLIKPERMFKGEKDIVDKNVTYKSLSKTEIKLRQLKENQARIFFSSGIESGIAEVVISKHAGDLWVGGIDFEKNSSQMKKLIQEQKNPKYRPPMEPGEFVGIDAYGEQALFRSNVVFAIHTSGIGKMEVNSEQITTYSIIIKINEVIKGNKVFENKVFKTKDFGMADVTSATFDFRFEENREYVVAFVESEKKLNPNDFRIPYAAYILSANPAAVKFLFKEMKKKNYVPKNPPVQLLK